MSCSVIFEYKIFRLWTFWVTVCINKRIEEIIWILRVTTVIIRNYMWAEKYYQYSPTLLSVKIVIRVLVTRYWIIILFSGSHQISSPRMALVRDLVRPIVQKVRQEYRLVQQSPHQRIKVRRGSKNCRRMVRLWRRDAATCRRNQEWENAESKR